MMKNRKHRFVWFAARNSDVQNIFFRSGNFRTGVRIKESRFPFSPGHVDIDMKTISSGMGAGLVKYVELADVLGESWLEFLTLDMKFQASKALTSGAFQWHCP